MNLLAKSKVEKPVQYSVPIKFADINYNFFFFFEHWRISRSRADGAAHDEFSGLD